MALFTKASRMPLLLLLCMLPPTSMLPLPLLVRLCIGCWGMERAPG